MVNIKKKQQPTQRVNEAWSAYFIYPSGYLSVSLQNRRREGYFITLNNIMVSDPLGTVRGACGGDWCVLIDISHLLFARSPQQILFYALYL